MGRTGCNFNGDLDDSMFGKPMLWIGIYVAVASLACLFAMATDAFLGFRYKKLWFPCKHFSLNSATLTILTVAVKFPMDLTSYMAHRQDQLAKLSSTILICTAMANFMPSLGTMKNKESFMNVVALSILVVTLVTNVSIQMGTGAIYIFLPEHAVILFSMLVLLVILVLSALTVPTTKHLLEKQYRLKLQEDMEQRKNESIDNQVKPSVKEITEAIKKSWMMAHTSSPQFVMGHWVICAASGAFCLLNTLILTETILRSYMNIGSMKFCRGESDYKWSTKLVLVIQSIAVGIGTIAPAGRWLNSINCFRCQEKVNGSFRNRFKVEKFWIQKLVDWKESPFAFRIHGQRCRKFVHNTKNLLLDFCIGIQTTLVLASKFIQFVSLFFVNQVNKFSCCFFKRSQMALKSKGSFPKDDSTKVDLSHVMYLEDEEKLVELIAKNTYDTIDCWINCGRSRQPTYLIHLLDKSTMSQGFKGVRDFDSDQIPSLGSKEAPHGWALPVVTLTSIAIALPNIENHEIKRLLLGVREGLRYVRLIEKNLDKKGELMNISTAADIMWLGVDLNYKWLDLDLRKLALEGKSPKEIVERLADAGKNYVMEFRNAYRSGCGVIDNPLEWPNKVLPANSMYRIGRTIHMLYPQCAFAEPLKRGQRASSKQHAFLVKLKRF